MSIRLIAGDCRDVLPTLAADSVQCVVSSPPYYALRSYLDASHPDKHREIGSEPTPDAYLATMVAVFREVKRVLRPDGTCWVNIGDSFCSGTNAPRKPTTTDGDDVPASWANRSQPERTTGGGLTAKQLLLMPARLALALQADGWWVRSDIIWHKPNPMPESCTDRPTSAHEHVFLLTKSARYYYDADAVREASDASEASKARYAYGRYEGSGDAKRFERSGKPDYLTLNGNDYGQGAGSRNLRNVWTIATSPFSAAHFATYPPELAERCIRAGTSERGACSACGKPWGRITDKAFVPQGDVSLERGIKGALGQKPMDASNGWDGMPRGSTATTTTGWQPGCTCHGHFEERPGPEDWISDETGERKKVRVYVPDTDSPPPKPCVVLDPFIGAGTTALVADRLQRDCIGIDLNTSYTTMAMERCRADAPLFADLAPVPVHPVETEMADLFAEAAE